MKLPRKVDYACRVLALLAQSRDSLARVEELAQSEGISANYLVQILNELRNAGLVESRRGRGGGYRLGRSTDQITLRQVIAATEGHLIEIPSLDETSESMRRLWKKVTERLDAELDLLTLQQWLPPAKVDGDWMI